jgi:alpha-tubulin suppressor-like RCC1 family protein
MIMKNALFLSFLAFSLAAALSACGGGDDTPPDTTGPATIVFSVASTNPLNGVNSVAIGSTVSVLFTKAVDTTTLTADSFTVTGPTGTVTGTIAYDDASNTAVFTPNAPFTKIALYSATVTTAVKDTSGSELVSACTLSFITGPLAAGKENHSMVLKSDGTIHAWGLNDYGQVGDGSLLTRETPTLVTMVTTTNVVSLAAGGYHSLALLGDGTVVAWGENGNGQLGDGTHSWDHGLGPVQVLNLRGITAIAAGYWHGLALRIDGTVWAWGSNSYGQLGDNSQSERYAPVRVSGLTNVIAIAAGTEFSLALKGDGTVWAWGDNSYGQLGDGNGGGSAFSAVPVQVSGLTGITAISGGYQHALALKNDGTVRAWGRNDVYQCGVDSSGANELSPVQAGGLSGITAIAAGGWHSLALEDNNTVWAWGSNYYGQSGTGSTDVNILVPLQVTGLSAGAPVAALAAGENHSFAMKTDGTLFSWGDNEAGQVGVGIGTPTYEAAPVQVGVY